MRLKLFFIFLICFHYTQAQMSDTTLLIGNIEEESLNRYNWFNEGYRKYTPSAESVDALKVYVADMKIMVVMGTWCSDSHELVPAFFKVATELGLRKTQIEMIGVDRKKHCPVPDISALRIEYVPTFFVFYKGELKGKIVETVNKSIEQDIQKLLQQPKQ
jgi:thiol-disulfide isomerase/thioredoxin